MTSSAGRFPFATPRYPSQHNPGEEQEQRETETGHPPRIDLRPPPPARERHQVAVAEDHETGPGVGRGAVGEAVALRRTEGCGDALPCEMAGEGVQAVAALAEGLGGPQALREVAAGLGALGEHPQ